MKKNYSYTAALAATTIASSIVFYSLSATAVSATGGCNFLQGKDATQAIEGGSPSSLVSSNQLNSHGNQWGILGIGAALAAGLVGMALKHQASRHQTAVVAETATLAPEFPMVSSFAIVVPPEALIPAQEADAELTSVG